jgi:hypothetical protein
LKHFTIRPKARPEESFSSYLLRIGSRNFAEYEAIYKKLTNGKFKKRDSRSDYLLDVNPIHILNLKQLSKLLKRTNEEIESLTCIPIYSKFLDDFNNNAHRTLGMSQFINHKNRRFCPECIKVGFFKLYWQIADIEICHIHELKLQTKCSSCQLEQPYLNSDTLIRGRCYNCGFPLQEQIASKVMDQKFIEKQKLLIRNYNYLINPKTVLAGNIYDFSKERSLAMTLLYLMNGEQEEFNRNALSNVFKDRTIRRIIDLARGIETSGSLTITKFFEIINELEIDISYMKYIKVPCSFINSFNHYFLLLSDTGGKCHSPWCESFNTNVSMGKVKVSRYFQGKEKYIKTYVCTKCYMKYGYRKSDGEWEVADNKIELIKGFVNYYINDQRMDRTIKHLEISRESFYDLLGYTLNYNLIPNAVSFKVPYVFSKEIQKNFRQLINEGGQLYKQARKKFKWSILEYYYYLNLPPIQNYLFFSAFKENTDEKKAEIEKKVDLEIKNRLDNNIRITVSNMATTLKTTKKTLEKYGLSKKIMNVAEKQKIRLIKVEKKLFMTIIMGFYNEKIKVNEPFLSKELYKQIGCSHTYLLKNHPDLYKYITKLVDSDKDRIREKKLEHYKITVEEVINQLINDRDKSVNQKNILEKLHLTDSIYRNYPEIKDLINKYLYQL